MATILGNISLCIAVLISVPFIAMVHGKAPPTNGDAAVGYPWTVIIYSLVLLGCLTLASICIAWNSGFDWFASDKATRYLLVGTGVVTAVVTLCLSALFKYENGPVPLVLKVFSGFIPALFPVILLLAGFVLLNTDLRAAAPVAAYQWPLTIVFWLGILGVGAGIYGWISDANKNAVRRMEGAKEDEARYHQMHLNDIDSCDVTKNMSNILVFTDANHDPEVRERAVAKVKTNPAWQAELIRYLEGDGSYEAFTFLASNDVDDKSLFAEPVSKGIFRQAFFTRQTIQRASHDSHFYPDQFSWEVERVLRTVEKMEGLGTDYRPAIRELRAALDEPSNVSKPVFHCAAALDRWLKMHP